MATVDSLNDIILAMHSCDLIETDDISDGYHTFKDLYEQRVVLSAALCEAISRIHGYPYKPWRSMLQSDGSKPFGGGWFIMGFKTPRGDFTYHYEMDYWHLFESCATLERAPEWDGHTSKDITRLLSMF